MNTTEGGPNDTHTGTRDSRAIPVRDVVGYFLQRDDAEGPDADVSNMKLQKLLYLAQGNYLAATGTRLFDEAVLAYDHGPVVYDVLKAYQGTNVALVRCGFNPPASLKPAPPTSKTSSTAYGSDGAATQPAPFATSPTAKTPGRTTTFKVNGTPGSRTQQ